MLHSPGSVPIWYTSDHIYFLCYSQLLTDLNYSGLSGSPLLPSCIFPEPDTVRNVCDCSAQLVRLTVLASLLDETF